MSSGSECDPTETTAVAVVASAEKEAAERYAGSTSCQPSLRFQLLQETVSLLRNWMQMWWKCMCRTQDTKLKFEEEIMDDPHIVADGFTCEHGAIKARPGRHNVSPVTKLRLQHTGHTPNHTLHSAIQEWRSRVTSLSK